MRAQPGDGPPEAVYAAVDWGGTWIRVALVSAGRILHRERIRRPGSLSDQYAAIASGVGLCAQAVDASPEATGVGIAGIVQGQAVMTAINLGIVSRTEVGTDLAAALAGPVCIANDTQSAASSLAHRWVDDVTAVLSMGTGVGGALIDRGKLVLGHGAAGDYGHMVLDVAGPPCPCGGRGCFEMLVSGKALAAAAHDLAFSGQSPMLEARYGTRGSLHAGDLQDAAAAGEPSAVAALRGSASIFASGIRSIVAAVDPARIVLTGSLLSDEALFGRLVRERWEATRPSWSSTSLVHVPEDEDATLLGAARLAAQHLTA